MRFTLLPLLFLLSCHPSQKSGTACDAGNGTCLFDVYSDAITRDVEGVVPSEALSFETNLMLANFSSSQEQKVQDASALIKRIVASEEFKDAVVNFTHDGKQSFVDTGGLSNLEIYYRFLLGAEELSPEKNNALDAELELYTEESSTVGYTTPQVKRIWMNSKFFNKYTAAQVAGNLMHEWMHKLGFGHSAVSTPSRPASVPYAIGYIITRLAPKFQD